MAGNLALAGSSSKTTIFVFWQEKTSRMKQAAVRDTFKKVSNCT
jgi:hypothetical protein